MIRGSDGLDYEDLTQRLLGNPLPTHRNQQIQYFRVFGGPEGQNKARVFIEAYDRAYNRERRHVADGVRGPG